MKNEILLVFSVLAIILSVASCVSTPQCTQDEYLVRMDCK